MANIKDFKWDVVALPKGKIARQPQRRKLLCHLGSQEPRGRLGICQVLAGPDSMGVGLLLDLQQMTPALTDYQKVRPLHKPAKLQITSRRSWRARKLVLQL
jgi:hypothetical protein